MAMVAAAIANHGVLMRPQLVERVLSPSGKTITHLKSRVLSTPIKAQTAAELTQMMELAVSGGTGTAAQIPGIRVAGKTGTAEIGHGNINTTWFAAFAPADAPKIAIAVVVENQAGGFGGTVAAPIARQVMEALLR
jgi:peptidoglycan glycosyltransferase